MMNAFCVEANGFLLLLAASPHKSRFQFAVGSEKMTRAIMNPSWMEAKGSRGFWQRVPQNQDINLGWLQKNFDPCHNESILYGSGRLPWVLAASPPKSIFQFEAG